MAANVRVVRVQREVKVPKLHKSRVHVPKFEDELQELAARAKAKLGYTLLHTAVNGSIELARTLRRLHIRAFKPELVEAYKKAKQLEQRRKLRAEGSPNYVVSNLVWNMTNLDDYAKPVPEFVLRKALQIKDELPNATFAVDELSQRAPDPDPFLIVSLAKERFYIEVWEEPKFEADVLAGKVFIDDESEEEEG